MDDTFTEAMYKEHILALYKHPSNFGRLPNPTGEHRSTNPLCGDDITMQLLIKDDVIEEVKFHGHGCTISIASASLITERLKGQPVSSLGSLTKEEVLDMLHIPVGPVRLKCALLPLEAVRLCLPHSSTVSEVTKK
ncbi:iron-sulfur cluster assembly scaffold protein [Candidatus Woesearchaeota archaeon]|nr:iron-sulfur cluster assembly scaffold protein [Candidatus Woesearchaeota archaeon]